MATRIKAAARGLVETREQLEQCVGELARLTIERDSLTVEMDERIRQIRAEYEQRIADLSADIETEFDMAQDWAERNKAEFLQRKSLDLVHGTVGFRTGTPKLKTMRGVKWDTVLMRMTQLRMSSYVRTKVEPDKEKLIADREKLDGKLAEIGCQVVQDETFFVEPKRESMEGN
jgi:phage host-nuclease inhibitor protein Gam